MMDWGQQMTVNFSIFVKCSYNEFCSETQNSRGKMGVEHAIWRAQDYLYLLLFSWRVPNQLSPLGQIGLELKRGPLKQKKRFIVEWI